jgi:hypothetical protein
VDRFVVISGCSGGGKSTLLAELGRRGHAFVEEPGRRIVKEELKGAGSALPWVDAVAFLRRAIVMALADRVSAGTLDGWVFFDRGLVDAAAGLQHLTGEPVLAELGQSPVPSARVPDAALARDLCDRPRAASRAGCGHCRIFASSRSLPIARLRSLCPTEDRGGGSRRLRPEGAGGVADPVGFGSESGLIRLAGQVEVREGLMDCGVTTWRAGRM